MELLPLSITDLAKKEGVNRTTVHRWIDSGLLVSIRIPNRKTPFYLDRELSRIVKSSIDNATNKQ